MNRTTRHALLLGLPMLLIPALASAGTTVQPGDILAVYKNLETQWASNAASIGTALFGVFAGLEFAWTWISWLLEKGGGDGESVVPTLLKKILQLTFGFWLVKNAASGLDLIGTLINGFEWLGTHIGGTSAATLTSTSSGGYLTPSGIFGEGITIAADMWKSAYASIGFDIGHDLGVVFVTVPMVLLAAAIFAFLALSLVMTLIETYLVIGAGAVFLALLGSRWTQQFGEKYISYAVSAGVKLFVFFLVLTAGQQLAATWISAAGNAGTNLMNYVGIGLSVLVYGMVAMKTPSLASSLISGAGGFLGAAGLIGAAAGAAAAAAAGAVTGGAALAGMGKLAAESGAGKALLGGAGKLASGAGDAAMSGLSSLKNAVTGGEDSGAPGLDAVAGAGGDALGSALGNAAGSMPTPDAGSAGAEPAAGGAGAEPSGTAESGTAESGTPESGTAEPSGTAESGTPESGTAEPSGTAESGTAESGTAEPSGTPEQSGTPEPSGTPEQSGTAGTADTPSRSGLSRVASAARAAGGVAQDAGKAGSATHKVLSGIGEKLQEIAEPLDASHNAAAVSIKLHD